MTTYTKAPDIPNPAWPKGGYPSKGKRLGPAWDAIWRALERSPVTPLDGKELADKVAAKTELAPATLVALLSRAAAAGILTKEGREVQTGRGPRTRMFYRIARPADADE